MPDLHPFWDGTLMHLAERINLKHGKAWRPRCAPPWLGVDHFKGQIVGGAVPTCLWCIVDMRRS